MIVKRTFDSEITENKQWFVLCVTPKREKKIAKLLADKGIEVYCPVLKKTKYSVEGETTVTMPLFKSYLFVRISKRNRVLVFSAPGVIRYLFHQGRPARIDDADIEAIRNCTKDHSVEEIIVLKYSKEANTTINNRISSKAKSKIDNRNFQIVLRDIDYVLKIKMKSKYRQPKLQVHHLN